MFRSGFFNAKNHDKQYYSSDVSKLFNSLINPGVFENVGNKFIVRPGTGMQVIVPSGMAWFNSTWTVNDSDEVIILDEAPYVANYNRIDAIFLRVYPENDTTVRDNTAYYVKGTETSGAPTKPVPTPTDDELYIPLCYITVNHGTTAITVAMIENCVGTNVCPFITGILETAHISDLLVQWQAQWNEWLTSEQNNFETWFESIRGQLDEDAAGHLQNEINDINDVLSNLSSDAVDVNFDDTTAQLGASNVQTAIEKLKAAFSSALTSLKATPIAQAVGATGSTFAAVIQKLNAIATPGKSTSVKWSDNILKIVDGNLGSRGRCSDNVVRSVFELPAGWYGSHDGTRDLLGITDAKMQQLGWVIPSGNKHITANGSNIDVKANATVSVSVNQTPTYGSHSPTTELDFQQWMGTSAGQHTSIWVRSTPTVSKQGSVIYVTVPVTLRLHARVGGWTEDHNIDFVVAMNI